MIIALSLEVTPGQDGKRADHFRLAHRGTTLLEFYDHDAPTHSPELRKLISAAIVAEADHLLGVSKRLKGRGN
jgi:hypothetical protein